MKFLKQIAQYLYLKKRDTTEPQTQFTGYMHKINRFTIFSFIVFMVILAVKYFIRSSHK